MIDNTKKTIIFDFGNILLGLDYKVCFDAFYEVLGIDFAKGLPQKTKQHLFRYEKGEINTESFLWHLQQYSPSAEIRDIISAWNSLLIPVPQYRFDMIAALRDSYNVTMLSNINDMHMQWIHSDLKKRLDIDDFRTQYFDKVFYSHLIGYRKPDANCYAYVQKELGIANGQDILFIDDMQVNIDAAIKFGWRGVVHDPKEEITDHIQSYLTEFNKDII